MDQFGRITRAYVFEGGSRLAFKSKSEMGLYVKDHLGSTKMVLALDKSNYQSAVLTAAMDNDAYGNTWRDLINTGNGGEADPHGYTGQEREEALGLMYYGARFYMPEIGRFLEVDPAREFVNPYSYVGNRPVIATDPSGSNVYFSDEDWNYHFFLGVEGPQEGYVDYGPLDHFLRENGIDPEAFTHWEVSEPFSVEGAVMILAAKYELKGDFFEQTHEEITFLKHAPGLVEAESTVLVFLGLAQVGRKAIGNRMKNWVNKGAANDAILSTLSKDLRKYYSRGQRTYPNSFYDRNRLGAFTEGLESGTVAYVNGVIRRGIWLSKNYPIRSWFPYPQDLPYLFKTIGYGPTPEARRVLKNIFLIE